MELSYGSVERLLMHLHGVPAARRTAMRSRIQHLQRLDFPRLPPAGRGARAVYDIDATFQLVAAFELARLNWPAQASTGLVLEWWPAFRRLVVEGMAAADAAEPPASFAVIAPDALASIRSDAPTATVEIVPGELIAAWAMRGAAATSPGHVLLDLAAVARRAAVFLREEGLLPPPA